MIKDISGQYIDHIDSILIKIPRNLSTDIDSYNFFSSFSEKTRSLKQENILVDFIANEWIDINACSILAALIHEAISNYNIVDFINVSPEVDELFTYNQFYKTVFNDKYEEIAFYGSEMPCLRFLKSESVQFVKYIDEGLLSMSQLPKMTLQLKKKINERLLEIFSNAHEHGNCLMFYSSGQYSIKKGIITMTLCNTGKTIRNNVNNFFNSKVSATQALEWAVVEGNTTRKGNIPGGLGISLLREFLQHNGGYLQIISCNGFWEEKKGKITTRTLNSRFSGTIVNIVINITDVKSYKLSSE